MYGSRPPFAETKPQVDGSSLIISPSEITLTTKNFCKSRAWRDDKTRVDSISQNKNSASDRIASTSSFKSTKERRHCDAKYRCNGYISWVFFLHTLMLISASEDAEECVLGLKTQGRTWPAGDIVLEHGEPLRIYCMLNKNLSDPQLRDRNASDLVFFREQTLVEPEYVTVVNKTTIMMYIEQPSPSRNMYYCRLKLNNSPSMQRYEQICLNQVSVGSKPKKPLNFSCLSYNWEKLVCTWNPAPNSIETRFSLGFKLPNRAGREMLFSCPERLRQYRLPPNTCLWDTSTSPHYRQTYASWTFALFAENILGRETFIYEFDHFANVIPSEPVNLSVVNKSSSSALLRWNIPSPMQTFPACLDHRVSYQSQWDNKESWQTIDIRNISVGFEPQYFQITDLHANTVYEVRIFLKSTKAVGEDKWSPSNNITFKTAATVPGRPPRTDVGSFQNVENNGSRDVYIYWQTIPEYLENGENITYRVISAKENGRRLGLHPYRMTKTYAIFRGVSFNRLTFKIVATNYKGASQKAIVRVPKQLEMPQKPILFTKIVSDGGGNYELSWNPMTHSDITNYTIFWCENECDHPCQCSGFLDWVHVPGNTSIYNVTVPDPRKVYQFAIALNTAQASSGMVWFSDTTYFNRVERSLQSVFINRVKADAVEIGWKLIPNFNQTQIIDGFNIHYCPILSQDSLTCKGLRMTTTFRGDSHTTSGVVRSLNPFSTYMFIVAAVSRNVEIVHSDPFYFTTLLAVSELDFESNLSPDTNLGVDDVLSSLNDFMREIKLHMKAIDRRLDAVETKITEFGVELDSLSEENR